MPEVRVYTTRFCAYCVAAKRLLRAQGIPYEEVDVTGDATMRAWLVETTGRKTVPQIFVAAESIGGYQELVALVRSGRLTAMLEYQQPSGERLSQPPGYR
jgi:glutaredoxin 3